MMWEKIKYPFCFTGKLPDNRVELFHEFIQFFGFDRMSMALSVGSYGRLLHGNRSYNNTKLKFSSGLRNYENVPAHDHARLFKRQGTNQIVYVNQPYHFDKEELEAWCNERGLYYVICRREFSFYYPNYTDMVLIMSMRTYNELLRIPGFPLRWKDCRRSI